VTIPKELKSLNMLVKLAKKKRNGMRVWRRSIWHW
jgi:hypothetical protein